jgi:hypothetical protein
MTTVGDLFDQEPQQWGLRGDRHLWRELRDTLSEVELPPTSAELERLLENEFWRITGASLAFCDEKFMERFSHGGMSSGYISGDFWRQRGFPLFVERFCHLLQR